MCDAGKDQAPPENTTCWRKECSIIIVGFPGPRGTLGRKIVDGAKTGAGSSGGDRRGPRTCTRSAACRRTPTGRPPRVGGATSRLPRDVFVAHGEESVSLEFCRDAEGEARVVRAGPLLRQAVDSPVKIPRRPQEGIFPPGGTLPVQPRAEGRSVLRHVLLFVYCCAFSRHRPRGRPAGCRPAGGRSGRETRRSDSARNLPFTDASGKPVSTGGLSRRRPVLLPSTTTPARCSAR